MKKEEKELLKSKKRCIEAIEDTNTFLLMTDKCIVGSVSVNEIGEMLCNLYRMLVVEQGYDADHIKEMFHIACENQDEALKRFNSYLDELMKKIKELTGDDNE